MFISLRSAGWSAILLLGLTGLCLAGPANAADTRPSDIFVVAPIPGFGSAAAGGDPARVVNFHDETVLRACADTAISQTCVGSPTLRLDGAAMVNVQDNKTIDCKGGTIRWSQIGFQIADHHNIIIRNCRFSNTLPTANCQNPSAPKDTKLCGIPVNIKGDSTNIAILHNTFGHCGEKCIEVFSEGLRIVEGRMATPDLVTVAYNDLYDSYFGIAVGSSAFATPDLLAKQERVTFAFNRCTHVFRRCARAASPPAEVDETDNVIRNTSRDPGECSSPINRGFGPSSTGGAQLLLRNNILDDGRSACRQIVDVSDYSPKVGQERGIGFVRAEGDLLNGDTMEQTNEPENVRFTPPAYPLVPASKLEFFVAGNVGPRP